ncbi:g3334 [Coccomyxa viridis]|uniref:G3334 protein n=1 Tax=Coccomyxa viridis TaxID=1274662 RepID=A0ABP1FUN5_9CHLO
MRAARNARRVWARSILSDDKETITGVQTLRNSIMAVTLFTVACGYVGARAIPELLLNNEWRENLETLQRYDPITRAGGGVPLLHPAVKLGIALGILFVSFMCFAQSGRLYSHVGFMLRAVSSNLCPEHWTFEGELLAVLDMAGFLFSLGLRIFMAFGLLVFWVVGPTTLLIVTVLAVILLFAVDFVSLPKSRDLDTLEVGHA